MSVGYAGYDGVVPNVCYGLIGGHCAKLALLVEAAMAGRGWKDGYEEGQRRGFEDGSSTGLQFSAPETGDEDFDRGYSEGYSAGFEMGCQQRRIENGST